jgi:hypothetical protein
MATPHSLHPMTCSAVATAILRGEMSFIGPAMNVFARIHRCVLTRCCTS